MQDSIVILDFGSQYTQLIARRIREQNVFSAMSAELVWSSGTSPVTVTESDVAPSVAEGQINAMIPYGIAVNTRHQVVVQRGSSYSVPEPVTVAAAQPAVFTRDQTGRGQGLIFVSTTASLVLADAASPAQARDAIVIFCSGLGAVDPQVEAGAAAPSSPLSTTVNPVSVTIGGREARVLFAGLAPGFAGLYQVNAMVPDGLARDTQTPVILTVAGQASPPVAMGVR